METKPGKTRTWIFIRGLTREAEHWGEFLEMFKDAFPNDRILCPDLPGTGTQWQEKSPMSIPAIARDMRSRVTQQFPHDTKFSLLAISLGGMVAADWIQQDPDRIETAVIINTSSKGLSPVYKRLKFKTFFRFLFLPLTRDLQKRERVIIERTSNNPAAREKALPSWVGIQQKRPISAKNAFFQIIAAIRYKITKLVQEIPILIVVSYRDRLVHPECSEKLRDYWKSDLIYHQTAGHDLSLDDPKWLTATVKNWIDLKFNATKDA